MTAPLQRALDRAIGTTRKAVDAVSALAVANTSAKAGADAIMLDNQLLTMMALRELLARETRAAPRPAEPFWIVPEREGKRRVA